MTKFHSWRMRVLSLVLCVLSVIALGLPASAVTQAAPRASGFTYTSLVHYWPSVSSAVIGQMENGTAVTVLGEYYGFYKIDCFDMTGYISKKQVTLKDDGKYYITCDLKSDETAKMEQKSLSDAILMRLSILALAQKQLGYPYVYGGIQPGGFDCSGLTYYVYGEHDYSLRRCADEQLQDGLIVAKEGLQIGDLIFFREAGSPWIASHVGIYAGDNKIIHASSRGICYSDLDAPYYSDYYLCARRIVNTDTEKISGVFAVGAEKTAARPRNIGIRTAS